jgi:hypothetical protein
MTSITFALLDEVRQVVVDVVPTLVRVDREDPVTEPRPSVSSSEADLPEELASHLTFPKRSDVRSSVPLPNVAHLLGWDTVPGLSHNAIVITGIRHDWFSICFLMNGP